jgi:hypothetical protein
MYDFLKKISKIHITPGWRRDTVTFLQSIQILIRICDWGQDHPVDSIEIRCTVSLTLRPKTCEGPQYFNHWMLTIGFEHSSSRVQGDFRLISSSPDDPFCCWLWMTQCWDGWTPPIGNKDEITDGWYIWSLLFVLRSRQRPLSSSSSSFSAFILD